MAIEPGSSRTIRGTNAERLAIVDFSTHMGRIFFETDTKTLFFYDGSDWYGIYTGGVRAYTTSAISLTLDETHDVITITAASKVVSLPTAAGIVGKVYTIDNSSVGNTTVTADGAETINGINSQTVGPDSAMTIISDNTNWRII